MSGNTFSWQMVDGNSFDLRRDLNELSNCVALASKVRNELHAPGVQAGAGRGGRSRRPQAAHFPFPRTSADAHLSIRSFAWRRCISRSPTGRIKRLRPRHVEACELTWKRLGKVWASVSTPETRITALMSVLRRLRFDRGDDVQSLDHAWSAAAFVAPCRVRFSAN